ncbi:membrane protein [Clostridioides difficile]|nr:membrane protein [Clostridioides difficile]
MITKFFSNILSIFLYFILLILGVAGITFLCMIPMFLYDFSSDKLITLIARILYFSDYFIVILFLIFIINSTKYSPFILENVKRFKIMGYCLLVNTIIECINGYSLNTNNIIIFGSDNGGISPLMIISFIFALMCFVIAETFDKAIKIKEDNDLTI